MRLAWPAETFPPPKWHHLSRSRQNDLNLTILTNILRIGLCMLDVSWPQIPSEGSISVLPRWDCSRAGELIFVDFSGLGRPLCHGVPRR